MPRHLRQPILDAAFAAIDAIPALNGSVRDQTATQPRVQDTPLASVRPGGESVVERTHNAFSMRSLEIQTTVWSRTAEERDNLAYEVEKALAAASLGLGAQYGGTRFEEEDTGAGVVYGARVSYSALYAASDADPLAP